jgi:hypothetical protein
MKLIKRIYFFLKYWNAPWDEGQISAEAAWSLAKILADVNQ